MSEIPHRDNPFSLFFRKKKLRLENQQKSFFLPNHNKP